MFECRRTIPARRTRRGGMAGTPYGVMFGRRVDGEKCKEKAFKASEQVTAAGTRLVSGGMASTEGLRSGVR